MVHAHPACHRSSNWGPEGTQGRHRGPLQRLKPETGMNLHAPLKGIEVGLPARPLLSDTGGGGGVKLAPRDFG